MPPTVVRDRRINYSRHLPSKLSQYKQVGAPSAPEEAIMRVPTISLKLAAVLGVLVQPIQLAPAQAAATQPVPWHPCARITAACSQSGFVPNGAKQGLGIMLDCVRPIMTETPQRKQATKALPQIDPKVVAACKQRNPNFGKRRETTEQRDQRES